MRIWQFQIQKLKSLVSSFYPRPWIPHPRSFKYLSPGHQGFLLLLALFIVILLYFRFYDHPSLPASEENGREVVVEILGEVRKPGIHLFSAPPSLWEAIAKAGGTREETPFEKGAFTEALEAGTLVTVEREPPQGIKVRLGRMEARKLLVFSLPLDLNQASPEDLCLVPGIGESLAQEIVSHRKNRRGFRSVEELRNVRGIGEKKYQSLEHFFTANP
jgi:DNA uptake protein ComE-like DNA-binding protein